MEIISNSNIRGFADSRLSQTAYLANDKSLYILVQGVVRFLFKYKFLGILQPSKLHLSSVLSTLKSKLLGSLLSLTLGKEIIILLLNLEPLPVLMMSSGSSSPQYLKGNFKKERSHE